jgi:sodium/hydrogen antiporter
MDIYILDLFVIGILLLGVTLGSGLIARLPLSFALIYLIVGILLSPYGVNLIQVRPGTVFLERASELVVLISLFSCGLKMSRPFNLRAWSSTIRLIGLLMPISIAAIAVLAHYVLKMDWAPAILLGAILAPTDPVLASEVQLYDPQDRNELRFGLTSEGGLNDALAFPFVYFGIRLLKDNNWQNWIGDWIAIDIIWAIIIGTIVGFVVAKFVRGIDRYLRRFYSIDTLMEDFIALSTILIAYSITEMVNGYGFLAVFVAGVIMRRRRNQNQSLSQLHFVERLEKLSEIGIILLLGSMLRFKPMEVYAGDAFFIVGTLFFIVRPLGAWISTIGLPGHPVTRLLYGWFGIRGVGSIYYLSYALSSGLKDTPGEQVSWITFWTIAISVILHGVTTTPLMNWYEQNIENISLPYPSTVAREEAETG